MTNTQAYIVGALMTVSKSLKLLAPDRGDVRHRRQRHRQRQRQGQGNRKGTTDCHPVFRWIVKGQ